MKDDHFEKYKTEIEPRMEELYEQGYHTELIVFMGGLLEKELVDLIKKIEGYVNDTLENSVFSIKYNNELHGRGLDRTPLGGLMNRLFVYIKDDDLYEKLNDFKDFRNNIIHHLLDKEISDIDKEIQADRLESFYKIMTKLAEKQVTLIKEEGEMLRILGNDE